MINSSNKGLHIITFVNIEYYIIMISHKAMTFKLNNDCNEINGSGNLCF